MNCIKKVMSLMLLSLAFSFGASAETNENYCISYSTTGAGSNAWDNEASYQLNTAMTKDRSYTISLKMKATETCDVALWPSDTQSENKNQWGGTNDVQYLETKTVTTDWATYTWTFTASFPHDCLTFAFGKLNGTLYIDDVKLVDDEVGVNMVQNGDFADNTTNGWSSPSSYNGTTFKSVTSDGAQIEVKEPEIPDTWEYVKQGNPNFQIYLCFGQSNMEGATQPEAIDYENVPERFKMMAAVNFGSDRKKGEWYTATPPLCRQGTGLCPADYFGRTMVENLPDSISVGVINVAVGGAKIELFMDEYKDDYIAGEAQWFKNICAQYDNAPLDRLIEMGKLAQKDGCIKGILLHQGESNNGQADWAQKVAKVYKRICYYLGLNPDETPLLAGETRYENMGGGCSWHNVNALPKLKAAVPNSYVISADGIEGASADAWHFSAQGYRDFGKRYAEQMLQLLPSTSDISSVESEVAVPSVTYNLQGMRVSNPQKGQIYIVNGKKVVE